MEEVAATTRLAAAHADPVASGMERQFVNEAFGLLADAQRLDLRAIRPVEELDMRQGFDEPTARWLRAGDGECLTRSVKCQHTHAADILDL